MSLFPFCLNGSLFGVDVGTEERQFGLELAQFRFLLQQSRRIARFFDQLFEKFNLTLQRIKLAFQTFALLLPTLFAVSPNFESALAQSPICSKRGKCMNKARHSLAIVFNDPTNVCSKHQNSPATGQRGGVVARGTTSTPGRFGRVRWPANATTRPSILFAGTAIINPDSHRNAE